MGKNLDSQQCLNHGEDNPLGRPLDLIINKCSVLRDEKDTSLNFTALSARRREITGTRETPKHVKRACMRPSAGAGADIPMCVYYEWRRTASKTARRRKVTTKLCLSPATAPQNEPLQQAAEQAAKWRQPLPTAPRTRIYCVVCHKPHVEVGGRSLLLPCESQRSDSGHLWQPVHLLTKPSCWSCFCF